MTANTNAAARFGVTFAGDSLNQSPASPNNYPTVLCSTRPTLRRYNVHHFGITISQLSSGAVYLGELDRMAKAALKSILILVVGHNDLVFDFTAASIYANMKTYADAWRTKASGVTPYVIGTTVTPSTAFTAGQETARGTLNASILANSDGRFDRVTNLAAGTLLSNAANTTDGTHWSTDQAIEAAGLVGADVDILAV